MTNSTEYVVVKRSGKPPLRFRGEQIVNANSFRSGPELWFEISVHSRPKGGYVVEIKCFQKSQSRPDSFTGVQCRTMAEVLAVLETYDVSHDLPSNALPWDRKSSAQVALAELELRRRLAITQREFAFAATPVIEQLLDIRSAH